MTKDHIGEILIPEKIILQRVLELGQQISNDYRDREVIIVCVLKGAVVFLADLLRCLEISASLDFVQISSYGDSTKSSGKLDFIQNLTVDIFDREVLVVDDILDSGLTLYYLIDILKAKRPVSIRLCVLLSKVKNRDIDINADYVGFWIPDKFVIGYGLDYAGKYRGLRYIATLEIS